MEKEYLIFIDPGKEVSQKIEEMSLKIGKLHPNTYSSRIQGEWISHIALYLFQVPRLDKALIKEVEEYFKKVRRFKVKLGKFKVKGSYVFVEVKSEKVKQINKKLVEIIKPFRRDFLGKYKERWDGLSGKEKMLIEETGSRYGYDAHVTVACVKEVESVLNLIKNESLEEKEIDVKRIYLLEFENGVNKLLKEFELKKN
ncbi:MAG: 2'-5' RNA ligase family protein [Candidatus Nanoarchaeia archaeon]